MRAAGPRHRKTAILGGPVGTKPAIDDVAERHEHHDRPARRGERVEGPRRHLRRRPQAGETLSVPITLAILVLAFGAFVGTGIPVLFALPAVGAAIGLVAPPSRLLPVDDTIAWVIPLIGMAVGVDDSLLYLRRARGACEGARRAERHRRRGGDLRARRAHLRPDRHGRHGPHGHGTFMSCAIGPMIVVPAR